MTSKEVWVRSNRRVLALAMIAPTLLLLVGVGLVTLTSGPVVRGLGWALAAAGGLLDLGVATQITRPRVAYRRGQVLFYLRPGGPIPVPVDVVEAFFLGQGPAHLPGDGNTDLQATNLVARISQKFPEWEHVAVKPALGRWQESYVTMNGPWCEPLNGDLIRRLNHRLHAVQAAAQPDAPQPDAPQSDAPQSDAPQSDAPQSDAPQSDAPQSKPPESDAP